MPVVPVWLDGTWEAMPPGRLLPHTGRVRLIIGEPIDADTYGRDAREIVAILHSKLATLGT